MDITTPGIGHNIGNTLHEDLRATHGDLHERADELTAAFARVPATIEDDTLAGKCADFVKQINACQKDADDRRVKAKAPYLEAGKTIDAFFKQIGDELGGVKTAVIARLSSYQQKRAEAERRRREDEARRLAEEAAKREAEAGTMDALDEAIEAHGEARKAEAEAAAKAADMHRARGDYGAVASIRTTWNFQLLSLALVPREYLSLNEQAVRAAIKAGKREIPGLMIFEQQQTVVR